MRPHLTTLNCGLGRDSIAMLCLLAERQLMVDGEHVGPEAVDAVLFADTGAEWPHTYALIPQVAAFCARMGVRFIHIAKPPEHGLDEYEFEMPTPPGLPEWTLDHHVFMADLDEDVTTVAQLQARPDALHNFRHAGSFPPPPPEDLQFDEEGNPLDREGNPL